MKNVLISIVFLSLMPMLAQARAVRPKNSVKSPKKAFQLNPKTKQILGASAVILSSGALSGEVWSSVNHDLGTSSMGRDTEQTVNNSFNHLAEVAYKKDGEVTQEGIDSLAMAITKSANWDSLTRNNVENFVSGLRDGISSEEANKLKEIKENCRI